MNTEGFFSGQHLNQPALRRAHGEIVKLMGKQPPASHLVWSRPKLPLVMHCLQTYQVNPKTRHGVTNGCQLAAQLSMEAQLLQETFGGVFVVFFRCQADMREFPHRRPTAVVGALSP